MSIRNQKKDLRLRSPFSDCTGKYMELLYLKCYTT